MASITKRGNAWRASVSKKGIRKTATFDTKAEASAWAAKTETEILENEKYGVPNRPFSDALQRYADTVSVQKKGARWEDIRLQAMQKMPIAKINMRDISARHFAEWRDERLKTVSPATVNQEWNLLSNVCTIAKNEWEWLPDNPMSKIKRPTGSKSRDRRISQNEIERILFATGYEYDKTPISTLSRVGAAFLFAIETAMRAGEIVGLQIEDIDLLKRTAVLSDTKNGTARTVPLSTEAIRLIKQLPVLDQSTSLFNITTANLDALFRKAKDRAIIEDLHFHDTRHEAITRLAKKLDVLALARMVGHRDLKMLMVYYNETAEELAKKLD